MKTISLRKFRDSIPDLTEPVSVTRRTPDGEYVTLGHWVPLDNAAGARVLLPDGTPYVLRDADVVPGEWWPADSHPGIAAGFGAPKPAPKPKR